MSFSRRRSTAVAALTTVTALGVLTATVASPAAGALSTRAGSQAAASMITRAVKPGRIGGAITLSHNVSFDGDNRPDQMATDKSGATYIAWISSKDNASGGPRVVHLCVIPSNARACAGGVKTFDPTGEETAAGLQLVVTPSGQVTILWIANTGGGGSSIYYVIASKTGPLSAQVTMAATLASNSSLFDAEPAPDGSIWILAESTDTSLQLRKGLTAPPSTIALPHSYGSGAGTASLVFSGATPIVVVAKDGGGSLDPNAYSYLKGSSWTAFANIPNSGAYGYNVGLVHTSSGVRLITGDAKDFYNTAISKWTGHSFTTAAKLGTGLDLGSHDASTDPSGRLIDVGIDNDKVTVLNLADTVHPAAFSFGLGDETAVDGPAVTTSARGRGWVAWSYQGGNSTNGDTLLAAPIVLAGLHTSRTAHGGPGAVKVVGPASCLPPVSLSVSVTGHPKKGWKVTKRLLTLSGKKVGASLNGESLTAGKTYSLAGTVTFGKGSSHKKVKATLKFKSCPNS